ncbi:MAG: hypothetical protein DI616_11310 [Paracoccus denitrificans]|uniref:Uncharacterized protein n=1 Tax=Paracoccus denitrificans TaxID=266 RepID=A0A533I8C9_PARDE|nr:MAG: hypothetical protein DI616_11310 [Paracoccus denitrificans]
MTDRSAGFALCGAALDHPTGPIRWSERWHLKVQAPTIGPMVVLKGASVLAVPVVKLLGRGISILG